MNGDSARTDRSLSAGDTGLAVLYGRLAAIDDLQTGTNRLRHGESEGAEGAGPRRRAGAAIREQTPTRERARRDVHSWRAETPGSATGV
jgi:hypothetical protein